MPVNFQQVIAKIQAIGHSTPQREQRLAHQRQRAWELFEAYAGELESLRRKVEQAAQDGDPHLRCACPWRENLKSRHPEPPEHPATLIALDGSQIIPDRHQGLLFGLINIGGVVLKAGLAGPPTTFTDSDLLFDEELRSPEGALLDEGEIALRRDTSERLRLLELARQYPAPVLTLIDGPLELWGAKDSANRDSYQKSLAEYLQHLDQLAGLGAIPAGYVDNPAADLVVRLLEVATMAAEDFKRLRELHPLLGASDNWLFANLLENGERSAVFTLQSSSRPRYTGRRAIHFFYLNVAVRGKPVVARVEIPLWVAEQPESLDLLHAAVVAQCRQMGAKPYPYLLHRAHEVARVSFDERAQVQMRLELELRRQGGEVADESAKHSAKQVSTEKRSYRK